jgi:protein disulfide-isomerase
MIERKPEKRSVLRLGGWMAILALGLLCSCAKEEPAGPMTWLTDLPKALEQAKAAKKLVMIDFTGSDWCPPCITLKRKVLATKRFQEYADKNLVLVEVDFPNNLPQTPELKKANRDLAGKYQVEGYPTVILLDANGKELSRSDGYSGASASEFIATLEKAAGK